jgi:hypothetical protein
MYQKRQEAMYVGQIQRAYQQVLSEFKELYQQMVIRWRSRFPRAFGTDDCHLLQQLVQGSLDRPMTEGTPRDTEGFLLCQIGSLEYLCFPSSGWGETHTLWRERVREIGGALPGRSLADVAPQEVLIDFLVQDTAEEAAAVKAESEASCRQVLAGIRQVIYQLNGNFGTAVRV